jgi:hypothetical protein
MFLENAVFHAKIADNKELETTLRRPKWLGDAQ